MKLVHGTDIYVPDHDTHFSTVGKKNRPVALGYQHDRLKAADKYLRGRRVAIDGGAHVGIITRQLAAHFREVLAFEPNPLNYECLVANTKHLKNVKTFNQALGFEPQTVVSASLGDGNSGNCYIRPAAQGVAMVTIDSLKLPALDLLKLDLQGYEYYALRGAELALHRHRPVCIVEIEGDGKLSNTYGLTNDAPNRILTKQGAALVERVGCDCIYTFPKQDGAVPFDKYERHGDYHWQKYDKLPSYKDMIDGCVDEIVKRGEKTLLDVGCGDGLVTSLLEKRGVNVLGIDNDLAGVQIAQEKGTRSIVYDVYDVAQLGMKFDAACLLDVFEHLAEQERALEELNKVTSRLYILNPEPCGSRYHTREFTSKEMKRYLVEQGWNIIHMQPYAKSSKDHRCLFICEKGPAHVQPTEPELPVSTSSL